MVGSALVARLRASGVRVLALARTRTAHRALAEAGAEPVYGDLTEPIGWRRDAAEADELWHLGLPRLNPPVRSSGARRRAREAETGAVALAEVFAGRRIVVASSALVYGERRGAPAEEGDPVDPLLVARAALAAEEALAGPETRIVRLPWVYGPAGLARDLIVGLRIGRYRVVGPGDNRWPLLGVEDAVGALIAAAEGPPGIYNAAEPEAPTQLEVVRALCAMPGLRVPDHVPPSLGRVSLGGAMSQALASSLELRTDRLRALGWAPSEDWRVSLPKLAEGSLPLPG
jgi:nucleoside-diphosphate-sugar epimerase